ncbi:MAG TPA: DinB family protein, partial [Anaerolineales bacterium]
KPSHPTQVSELSGCWGWASSQRSVAMDLSAPSLSEIRPYAQRTGSALAETAEQMQSSDSIQRNWNEPEWLGQPAHYRAVGLLIQVVNHGVEHRTNITTIMAQSGIEPPGLDGWEYMRLNPDRMGAS